MNKLLVFGGILVLALAPRASAQDTPDEEKIKEWIEKLGSDFLADRDEAKQKLLGQKDNEAARKIIEKHLVAKLGADDLRFKIESIDVLTQLGNKDAKVVAIVGKMFQTEQEDDIVIKCFEYLKGAAESAEDFLIEALKRPGPIYKNGALEKLKDIKSVKAMEPAFELYTKEDDNKIKMAAFQLIKALGKPAKKYLLAFIVDKNSAPQIKRESIEGLNDVREDDVIKAVGTMLKLSDLDPTVIAVAFTYMRGCPTEKVEDYLIAALPTANKETQKRAIQTLGEVRSEKALEPIAKLASEKVDPDVKLECITFYGTCAEKSEAHLLKLLEDENDVIRKRVIDVLKDKRSKVGFKKICDVYRGDKKEDVRKSAYQYFVAIGADAAEVLLEGLKDKSKDIKRDAIEIVGELKLESAIVPLMGVLEEDVKEIDALVINALAKIGRKAIAHLEDRVKTTPALKPVVTSVKELYDQVQVESALADLVTAKGGSGNFAGMFDPLLKLDVPKDKILKVLVSMQVDDYRPQTRKLADAWDKLSYLATLAVGALGEEAGKQQLKARFDKMIEAPEFDLGLQYVCIALAALGDSDPAEKLLARLQKEADGFMKDEKSSALDRFFSIAMIQNRLGRQDKALDIYKKMEGIILHEKDRDLPQLGRVDYNISCLLSLKGDKEGALKYLREAVEAGFRDREWIKLDKDLDAVRADPAFEKLIADDKLFRED